MFVLTKYAGLRLWRTITLQTASVRWRTSPSVLKVSNLPYLINCVSFYDNPSLGGTREMGTQLTTLVMWHKQFELKLRGLNQLVPLMSANLSIRINIYRALATNFLASMQSKIEEFRKSASTLEKECDKGKNFYSRQSHHLQWFRIEEECCRGKGCLE